MGGDSVLNGCEFESHQNKICLKNDEDGRILEKEFLFRIAVILKHSKYKILFRVKIIFLSQFRG